MNGDGHADRDLREDRHAPRQGDFLRKPSPALRRRAGKRRDPAYDLRSFLAIRSASATWACGMNGLLFQPGREEVGEYSPGFALRHGMSGDLRREPRLFLFARVSPVVNTRFLGRANWSGLLVWGQRSSPVRKGRFV
ncbi:MAG: hypothetical protein R3D30_07710 [Hyphomicrobiales bacterium]